MSNQNSANITSESPDTTGTKKQYGIPVTPYLADQERMDRLGKVLEERYRGEYKRPATLSRALDALERELAQPTEAAQ